MCNPAFMPGPWQGFLEGEKGPLEKPRLRVLVVDDYSPLRLFVCSKLQKIPEVLLIDEASDGLEAVQKAKELQPDLMVMDIGLPKLNGIEATRQIIKLSPHTKVLIVSQESSPDMIQKALATGAKGYVIKVRVEDSLLTAVNAVLRGELFIVAE
jgi:DNA-binding NarL/FixJ family response regulator